MLDEFIEAFAEWMVDTVAAVYDGLKWLITLPFRMIKQSRRYILIRKLEKALGIRLRDWQIKYIFGECDDMPGGRGCGKTLAHCIRLCLSKGDPIIVKNKRIQIAYLDEQHGWQYCEHYASMLREVYYKLMFSRIKLREIVFIRSNTKVEGKQDGKGKRKRKTPIGGDEIKIFVEVTESQYNQIKKMLADAAETESNLNRLILLVKSALTFGHGEKVFIKTNDAAKELLDYVWSITEGF